MVTSREAVELTRARDLAWADAFAGLSRVAAALSARLREIHDDGAAQPTAPAAPARPRRRTAGPLGPRQQSVLALRGLDGVHGLSAGEVAKALDLRPQNAQTVLRGLEKTGVLEPVPDEAPRRWRRART